MSLPMIASADNWCYLASDDENVREEFCFGDDAQTCNVERNVCDHETNQECSAISDSCFNKIITQNWCYYATEDGERNTFCFGSDSQTCNSELSVCSHPSNPECSSSQTSCFNRSIYSPPEAYEITQRISNPLESGSVFELIRKLYRAVMMIAIPILVVALVYTGFVFVSAAGNEDKLKNAKRNATYIVVGIIIILAADIILTMIESFLAVFN